MEEAASEAADASIHILCSSMNHALMDETAIISTHVCSHPLQQGKNKPTSVHCLFPSDTQKPLTFFSPAPPPIVDFFSPFLYGAEIEGKDLVFMRLFLSLFSPLQLHSLLCNRLQQLVSPPETHTPPPPRPPLCRRGELHA